MTPRRNKKGYNVVEVANPQECIGCKMCEINCPDFVIHVIKKAASDA
jgi:NAD-dependent dihydropyrimidine dehydrogenase PreA subunit